MDKKQFSDNDRAFYSDGYKLGSDAVHKGLKNEGLFQSIRSLYSEVDNLINSLMSYAKSNNVRVDCAKGCDWCCHQPVYAISHEIHYLSDYITTNFTSLKIEEVITRAQIKNEVVEKLSESELLNHKAACPLLENGACIAYEARPMACRIYLSMNVKSCKEFYTTPEKEDIIVELMDFPLRVGKMMNEGFKAALKSGNRNSTEFRLEHGLLVELTNEQV